MLAFLSALLISVFTITVWFLKRFVKRRLFLWVPLIILVFFVWLIWLILPIGQYPNLVSTNWFRLGALNSTFILSTTVDNWVLCFSYLTACLTVLITAPLRIHRQHDVGKWIESAILLVFGILAVTLQTLWALVALWFIFDIFSWLMNRRAETKIQHNSNLNSKHIFSWFLILVAASISQIHMEGWMIALLPQISFGLILFASVFRIVNWTSPEPKNQKNYLIQITEVIIGLSWVWQYHLPIENTVLQFFTYIILGLFFVIFLMFYFSGNSSNFAYLKYFSIITTVFFINTGYSSGILFFFSCLIMIGGLLDSDMNQVISGKVFIFFLGFIASGIPFALFFPHLHSWQIKLFDLKYFLNSLIIMEFTIIVLRFTNSLPKIPFLESDTRQQGFAYAVMGVQVFSVFLVSIKLIPLTELFNGLWWIGIGIFFTSILIFFFYKRKEITIVTQLKASFMQGFISFQNPTRIVNVPNLTLQFFSKIIKQINIQLEGSGGLLWALVILALFISALRIQGI